MKQSGRRSSCSIARAKSCENVFTVSQSALGFSGTTTIKRSDFGVGAYAPMVSDQVVLHIHAAFAAS